ncbi:MAG: hypothetical protein ACM3YM_13480 [Sphingomonadales bacterium]
MSGPTAFFPRGDDRAFAPVAGADLAQGLLLVRASTMKVLRLQLAMERRDRAVALQAMDDLVELDDRIGEFLSHMPAGDDFEAIARDVEEQKSALAREKFSLAAGFVRRGGEPAPAWVDPPAEQEAAQDAAARLPDFQETLVWIDSDGEAPHRSRRTAMIVAALFLLMVAAAASAYFLDLQPAALLDQLPMHGGL